MKRHHDKINGFTLVELILVITLLSLFSMTLIYLLEAANNSYNQSKLTLKQNAELSLLIQRLRTDFTAAMPNSFSQMTSTQCRFTNTYGKPIVYTFNNGTLTRQENAGTAYVLANQLATSEGIVFNYLQNDGFTLAVKAVDIKYLYITITTLNNNVLTVWIDCRNAQ